MLSDYFPILMMAMAALAFAAGNVIFSFLIGPRIEKSGKLDPYECGMAPVGNPLEPFSVKYFLPAMAFVIFDIEVVFLFLWAVIFKRLGWFGLAEMAVFLAVLALALVYVWKKGVLEWGSKTESSIS